LNHLIFRGGLTVDRFIKSSCGSILDLESGLEWVVGPDQDISWYDAKIWVETLTQCGGQWRLPTRRELADIHQDRSSKPYLPPLFTTKGWYVWSSYQEEAFSSRGINFIDEQQNRMENSPSRDFRVFAVRMHPANDKREIKRHATKLIAIINAPSSVTEANVENVSGKGLFIKTKQPINIGTKVRFRLLLQSARGATPIAALGKVAFCIAPEAAKQFGRDPGIGINLDEFPNSKDKQIYLDFIKNAEKTGTCFAMLEQKTRDDRTQP
jgi:Tfp pilus assembly protein PilZ